MSQFRRENAAVALTRRALYVDKSQLFGPCDFVMGADTASRVLDAKYYGGVAGLAEALDTLRERGCGFVVAGRLGEQSFVDAHEALASAPDATGHVPRDPGLPRTSRRRRLERGREVVPRQRYWGCLLCSRLRPWRRGGGAAAASVGSWEQIPRTARRCAAQSPRQSKAGSGRVPRWRRTSRVDRRLSRGFEILASASPLGDWHGMKRRRDALEVSTDQIDERGGLNVVRSCERNKLARSARRRRAAPLQIAAVLGPPARSAAHAGP